MTNTRRPPVVMQIIPALDSGGAERTVLEITEALVQVGARALVVSEGGRLVREIEALGGTFIAFPAATKNPAKIIANGKRLAKIATRLNVDILHARSRAPAWSAQMAAKRTGCHFVTTFHGAYSEAKIEPLKTLKKSYNGIMARGARVIANSQYTAAHIRNRYRIDENRLRVIYRGIDLNEFDAARVSEARMERLRTAWQVAPTQCLILVPGRLTPLKGQSVVISAMAALRAQGQFANSIVIFAGSAQGRDDYVTALQQQIEAAGLADHMRLVGHCSDMAAAYKLATVTIAGSLVRPEAFGRTAAEAQAMGCPVIATDLGAPAEVVRDPNRFGLDQATGWLTAPNDPEQLAAVLQQIAQLPQTVLTAMRGRARQNIIENFSLDRMKRATLAVYDELLGSDLAIRYRNNT